MCETKPNLGLHLDDLLDVDAVGHGDHLHEAHVILEADQLLDNHVRERSVLLFMLV